MRSPQSLWQARCAPPPAPRCPTPAPANWGPWRRGRPPALFLLTASAFSALNLPGADPPPESPPQVPCPRLWNLWNLWNTSTVRLQPRAAFRHTVSLVRGLPLGASCWIPTGHAEVDGPVVCPRQAFLCPFFATRNRTDSGSRLRWLSALNGSWEVDSESWVLRPKSSVLKAEVSLSPR